MRNGEFTKIEKNMTVIPAPIFIGMNSSRNPVISDNYQNTGHRFPPVRRFSMGQWNVYRSISPSTISMLPIAETTSAMRPPSIILGRAPRFRKDGGRILTRKGWFDPSLTM